MSRQRLLRVIFLVMLAVFQPTLCAWQKLTTVEFFVTDNFGITSPGKVKISVIPNAGYSSAYIMDYPRVRQVRLGAGEYTVVADAQGFLLRTQQLAVSNNTLFITIPLIVAPIEVPEPLVPTPIESLQPSLSHISGKLGQRYKGESLKWVRVVGLYNGVERTAKVDEGGSFTIEQIPPGGYLLLIFGGGTLKETRPINIQPNGTSVAIE